MDDKLFFLSLLSEAQLRTFAAVLGVSIGDARMKAPGIARALARKRSLTVQQILARLGASELSRAASQLGLGADGSVTTLRARIAGALKDSSVRALHKAFASQVVELEVVPVKLVKIVDGDTIVVRLEGSDVYVRFRGMDAPEEKGSDKAEADLDRSELQTEEMFELGRRSTRELKRLLGARSLFLELQPTPAGPLKYLHHRQHRLLAYLRLDRPDGDDVGMNLLRSGHALVWPRNLPTRRYLHPRSEAYVRACNAALDSKPGLWTDGLSKLCPRFDAPKRASWTLDDCKDCCFRTDWRET
jgi:endonuclease YncB( thermonuclease family)